MDNKTRKQEEREKEKKEMMIFIVILIIVFLAVIFLDKKFKTMIEGAYSNSPHVILEAEVKYRDGRTATVKTEISIRDSR